MKVVQTDAEINVSNEMKSCIKTLLRIILSVVLEQVVRQTGVSIGYLAVS